MGVREVLCAEMVAKYRITSGTLGGKISEL